MALDLLFLTQTYPRFAGDTAGPFIEDLARALVRGGDRVTVLAPHAEGLPERWEAGGVEVMTFRYAPERREVLGYGRSLQADERVKRGAALVTPFYMAAARGALSRLLRQRRRDLVHAHWIVPNGPIAAAAAGRTPLAIGLHGSDVFLAERRGMRSAVRWALRRTLLLTGCSPELVARIQALGFAAASRVIPYGVDTQTFAPAAARRSLWRGRLGIPESAPLVLGIGRMVTKKGFQVLLAALPALFAAEPYAHVILAGGGDLLEPLRATAAERWPGRLHLPGPVLRDVLPDLFRAADLFVLPAMHDRRGNVDGLPNVILEAMASGLPVIASGISGIPLVVEHGASGLLVPEQDPEALGTALVRLLRDRDLARRLGARGRQKAERELTWDAIAARYRDAYQETLAGC